MKYGETVEKLDLLQKIRLVASGLDRDALEQAGVPSVPMARLDDLAASNGVSYACAARAWNGELLSRMTEELVADAGADGARLFVAPDLKAVSPQGKGLSEDACLNGVLGRAIVRGVHAADGAAALSRPTLSDADVALLDKRADPAAVYSLAVKPCLDASREGCEAVFLDVGDAEGGYPAFNRALFSDAVDGYFGKDVFVVGKNAPPTQKTLSLLRGNACVDGARIPLERAALRYERLAAYREEGSVSARDVEDAVRQEEAFDTDALDGLADRTVAFCTETSARVPADPMGDDARRAIAAECIVLLKNEHILPLTAGKKIAVIGEAYEDLAPLIEKFEIVGSARGYERDADRSEELIPAAVRAAAQADAVLLFLYPGKGLAMPANRIALIEALVRTKKPVVALVCGDAHCDMSFDKKAAATLLVPADGRYACEALAKVLCGEAEPAGRLTRSLYDDAAARFSKLKEERDAGVVRMGAFAGYLRYDYQNERIRYPFGYGLGYTKFAYSNLAADGDAITFTVKNVGKRAGWEVAQVYVGAPSLTRLMPKKQLKAFRKIYLEAGESQEVRVELPREAFETYDPRLLCDTVEAGEYNIYVASSALDVKLAGVRTLEGETREGTPEDPAVYFSDSDHFERNDRAEEIKPPKWIRLVRKTALYALPAAVVLAFLLLTVLVLSAALDIGVVSAAGEDAAKAVLFLLAAAAIGAIPLFGSLNRRRLSSVYHVALVASPLLLVMTVMLGFFASMEDGTDAERVILFLFSCLTVGVPVAAVVAAFTERELRRSKSGTNRWEKYYHIEEREKTLTPEEEVDAAFREVKEREDARKSEPRPAEPVPEIPQFYDRSLTYPMLVHDCAVFVRERGLKAEEAEIRRYIAALTAAQLLVIPEGNGARLAGLVAQYFGKPVYTDNAEGYARGDDLFFRWRVSDKNDTKTQLRLCAEAAAREPAYLFTALIRHVTPALLERVLAPLAELVTRKRESYSVSGEEIGLPPNLRVVVEVGDGSFSLPASVAEAAAYVTPVCEEGEEVPRKTLLRAVGYERFAAMRHAVRDEYPLSEAEWKKIDALDARCRGRHIGNLLWIKTELHASVAAACGDDNAAFDALRAELLPWLSAVWEEETPLSGAVSEIFGEITDPKKTETKKKATKKEEK